MNLVKRVLRVALSKKRFILYISIGFTGLTLDIISFIIMVRWLGMNEFIANTISMSIGITNNFFLNAFLNFKRTDRLLLRYVSFYSVGLVGIAVGNLFLWIFMIWLGAYVHQILVLISQPIALYQLELVKGGSIVFIAVMQYFLNKHFSFRGKKEEVISQE
ncbi:MAG: GtrA family protein [Candidatus Dojkabacteria bacterium]|nr:MAG: GtrA family protein [Candidatus Dojkabacteria bacterium]